MCCAFLGRVERIDLSVVVVATFSCYHRKNVNLRFCLSGNNFYRRPCMYVQNQYNFLSFFPFYSLLFVQGRMTRMVQTPFCLFVFVFLIAYGQSFSTQQISSATNIQETSNELVGLLLSPKEKRDKQKIQDLVKELVEAKVTVDLEQVSRRFSLL